MDLVEQVLATGEVAVARRDAAPQRWWRRRREARLDCGSLAGLHGLVSIPRCLGLDGATPVPHVCSQDPGGYAQLVGRCQDPSHRLVDVVAEGDRGGRGDEFTALRVLHLRRVGRLTRRRSGCGDVIYHCARRNARPASPPRSVRLVPQGHQRTPGIERLIEGLHQRGGGKPLLGPLGEGDVLAGVADPLSELGVTQSLGLSQLPDFGREKPGKKHPLGLAG